MQQFLAVIFVLLSLWGAVWYFRKKGFTVRSAPLLGRKQTHPIQHVDRMRLTPHHSIHLLRVDGRNHQSILFMAITPSDPVGRAMLEFVRRPRD